MLESRSIFCHTFAIAFHVKLLYMRWEPQKSLTIRQYSPCAQPANKGIVKADQTQHRTCIFAWRLVLEVLINLIESFEKRFSYVIPVIKGKRQNADCTGYRKATSNPIPKSKHVLSFDAKFGGSFNVSTNCTHMLSHCFLGFICF